MTEEKERRKRIIEVARETCRRVDEMLLAGCAVDDPMQRLIRDAATDYVDRPDWRMRPRFDPPLVEPRRRGLDTAPPVDWAEIDRRIAAQIASERKTVFDVVAAAVEACEAAFNKQQTELRKVEVALAQSESRLTTLVSNTIAKLVPPTRSSDTISDLPNPLQGRSSSRVN